MKKLISLILCIAMLTLVLVSCGEDEHVHQYNRNEWKNDENNHWYAASCDCSDAGKVNSAAHYDLMNDGYCDVCGYLMCAKTEYVWEANENVHWQQAKSVEDGGCGHIGQNSHLPQKDIAAHTYNEQGVCSVCSYTVAP